MRRMLSILVLSTAMLPTVALVGCDDTLEHEKTVKVKDNGTTVTDEKKVTQSPDGTVTKTQEHEVNP
jgi:hypothetical protein